ncbi:MAG: CocE/NonD family hydrolase [Mycobacterium sp.]
MGASLFVGRVGMLAVALGVGVGIGAAAFVAGSGVALADTADAPSAAPADDARSAGPARAQRSGAAKAERAAARGTATAPRPAAASAAPERRGSSAPQRAAVARAAVSAGQGATDGFTVAPTVQLANGIVRGTLNATSARYGNTSCSATQKSSCLTYEFVSASVPDSSESGKLNLGTVPVSPTAKDPQSYTILPYLTWDLDTGAGKNTQTFNVRVTEVTDFDALVTGLPLIGLVAGSVIGLLQQTPLVGSLLAPIIGSAVVAEIPVDVAALAPGATPVAFTYKVTSFDGVEISTNFFPAAEIQAGNTAPLVLNGPGLPLPGETDPYPQPLGPDSRSFVPPLHVLRTAGYNVISWDPRGEYASGGIFELDNPFYEGRDTSAIISWAADNPLVQLDGPDDPTMGMVGGSYGGGIQLVTAATDPRVDAIVPCITWNSLSSALYPTDVVKTAWLTTLLLGLVGTGARINTQLYSAALTGLLFGSIDETAQAVLGSSGSTTLLNQLKAPALLVQSNVDTLFPLAQAIANAERIEANPFATEIKMSWFCGLHGVCRTPVNPDQAARLYRDTIAWLDTYVAKIGDPAADIPRFQWYDQNGTYYSSDLLPYEPGFNLPVPYSATGDGGMLPIIPVIGGSGPLQGPDTLPSEMRTFPYNGTFGTPATNALNVAVTPPVGSEIAGAPQLSFDYQGIGNGKAVFAQLIDNTTGLVVGNDVTPIPVTLNGQAGSVSIPMQDIAYTVGVGDSLTLQIVAYSSLYANSSIGAINVSNVQLDLPLRAPLP